MQISSNPDHLSGRDAPLMQTWSPWKDVLQALAQPLMLVMTWLHNACAACTHVAAASSWKWKA